MPNPVFVNIDGSSEATLTTSDLENIVDRVFYGARQDILTGKAYIDIIKIVVWFSLSVLILTILKNMGVLPDIVLNGLLGLVIIGGVFYTLWLSYDISLRDSMNFSEYNWGFSKPSKSDTVYEKPKETSELGLGGLGLGCIGEECCSYGMTYDSEINKCIASASGSSNSYVSTVKASNDVMD